MQTACNENCNLGFDVLVPWQMTCGSPPSVMSPFLRPLETGANASWIRADCSCYMQVTCDENFKLGFNRVYDKNLANGLRRIYKSHEHLFEALEDKGNYQLDLAANSKTIRDFDDAITRVSFGWPSVDAYYAGESPPQALSISTPVAACFADGCASSSKSSTQSGAASTHLPGIDSTPLRPHHFLFQVCVSQLSERLLSAVTGTIYLEWCTCLADPCFF